MIDILMAIAQIFCITCIGISMLIISYALIKLVQNDINKNKKGL